MVHKSPSKEEHEQNIEENNESLKKDIVDAMKLAEEVQEEMRELERYLLEEKEPSWEDEQKAQSLLENQKKLQEKVAEIQQQQSKNQKKQIAMNNLMKSC